jgi:hypothetical protein
MAKPPVTTPSGPSVDLACDELRDGLSDATKTLVDLLDAEDVRALVDEGGYPTESDRNRDRGVTTDAESVTQPIRNDRVGGVRHTSDSTPDET